MINELLLLSKNDIPFLEAQVNIHQPTISEISLISEESFFSGCQFLNFSKDDLKEEDKIGLEDKSDFEIFMSIMSSKETVDYKVNVNLLFALLFPTHQIKFTSNEIILINEQGMSRINQDNFDIFKTIVNSMFDADNKGKDNKDYNPVDKRAAKIAEKLQKAKNRKLQDNQKVQKVAVFSRYVSILALGEGKDMNELMQYTVYQLKDEFKRFQMKQAFDINMQARMAGATDLDDVDNWMDDIHP